MTPAFQVIANGADVSATIADRLVSIEVFDEDTGTADRIELVVDDRDGAVSLPDMDARLEVWLGFRETGLSMMGVYAVDGLAGEGMPQMLTISATAADMKSGIRAPRTRAWEDKSLADILATIAGEAGLRPVVAADLGKHRWTYVAQTAESDLHFLTRLAAPFDATVKPSGGALIAQIRGGEETAAGDAMPTETITRGDLTGWSWQIDSRERAGSVSAEWADPDTGRRTTLSVGDGQPTRRLRHVYGSEGDARNAAQAELQRGARGEITLSAEAAGFFPGLIAGAAVEISGLRPDLDGRWHLTRVTHRLRDGLRTAFEAKGGMT